MPNPFPPLQRKPAGMTLLEILIAASVLAMLMTGVYKIYQSVARTQQVGSWTNSTTIQIRNGFQLLQTEIGRVTKPEKITQKGTEPLGYPECEKFFSPSTIPYVKDNIPSAGDEKLLQFYMCDPEVNDVPGMTPTAPEIMVGILEIRNHQIVYRREANVAKPAGQPGTRPITQLVCADPFRVEISLRAIPDAELSAKKRNTVIVNIIAQHPKFPNTRVSETVEAYFEVPVKNGGYP